MEESKIQWTRSRPNPKGRVSQEHVPPANDYLTEICHSAAKSWWHDPKTGEPIKQNINKLLMLYVSELSEAMEGHRKGLKDDKLPDRPMLEVEIADALIRLYDLAGGLGLDVGGAMLDKLHYNAKREDHKPENRLLPGGKAY